MPQILGLGRRQRRTASPGRSPQESQGEEAVASFLGHVRGRRESAFSPPTRPGNVAKEADEGGYGICV